jgi:hypothetical protein
VTLRPLLLELTVNFANFFKRLVQGDHAIGKRGTRLYAVVVWLFIALVALFLTQPTGGPASVFSAPVPLPAELELEPEPAPAP